MPSGRVATTGRIPGVLAGVNGWWRADLGVTKDGSNKVSLWNDGSGGQGHVAQATAGSQPLWLATDAGGKPAIQFDGVDDFLNKPTRALIVNAYSIFGVVKFDSIAGSSIWFSNADGGAGIYLRQLTVNRGVTHITILDATDGAAQATSYEVWSVLFNTGSSVVLRINGVAQSLLAMSTILPPPPLTSAITFGARYAGGTTFDVNCPCRVAELASFPTLLSTPDALAIERYMGALYGITVA